MHTTKRHRSQLSLHLLPAALLLAGALLAGCSVGNDRAANQTAPAPPKPLTLELASSSSTATSASVLTVRGRATPGAQVTAGQTQARVVEDGRFRARVRLRVGLNRISVTAHKPGHETVRERLAIRRSAPPPVSTPTQTAPVQCPPGQIRQNGSCLEGAELNPRRAKPSCPAGRLPQNGDCIKKCPGGYDPTPSGCRLRDNAAPPKPPQGEHGPCPPGYEDEPGSDACILPGQPSYRR